MAYTITKNINNRADTRQIPGSLLRIGRGTNNDLWLDDTSVSLEHAHIRQDDKSYILTDQNSITGTYVNGKRVQTALLADGDLITIGPFQLSVRIPGPGETATLEIGAPQAAADPKGGVVKARSFNYVTAYGLRRKLLNKTVLSLVLTLAAAALLASFVRTGRTNVFRPGSVSVAHALFTNQCSRCHEPWHGPVEQACKDCHASPVHHKEEAFTPSCLSCHAEHRDQSVLAEVVNQQCVTCHADLKTKEGKPPSYEQKVTDFAKDHPEFAITAKVAGVVKRLRLNDQVARQSDPARIKLNHETHLKRGLKSPKGPVQLECKNCHMPATDGMRMEPIAYQVHCKQCHELGFDSQFPNRIAPHASPEIVHSYLVRVYAELRGEMLPTPERSRRLPGPAPSSLSAGLTQSVRQADKYLFNVTCKQCHALAWDGQPFPRVEKPGIPSVWLPHARFEHKTHRQVKCASCHQDVSKSSRTADVLLPGIETCRECHRAGDKFAFFQEERARTDCTVCHLYHGKTKDREWDGPFTVQRLLTGGEAEKARPREIAEQMSSFRRYLKVLSTTLMQRRD